MNKETLIVWLVLALLFLLGILGLVLGGIFQILGILFLVGLAGLFLGGLRIIDPEERAIVQVLGRFYKQDGPGLIWVCPGFMRIRAIVGVWEQTLLLFEDASIKIDFPDGSAVPKGVEVFVKIRHPDQPYLISNSVIDEHDSHPRSGIYRVIYRVDNWRKKTVELLENAVRSTFSGLTIDDVLVGGKGGFDLLGRNRMPSAEKNKIKRTLEVWGLDLLRITVTDFDLEPDLVKARGEVQKRKREADAAKHEKIVRAEETVGALIQMLALSQGKNPREIQSEITTNPEMSQRLRDFSEELITRRMSLDGKALTDIRVGGGGDLEQGLMRLIAATKASLGATQDKGKRKESEKEE